MDAAPKHMQIASEQVLCGVGAGNIAKRSMPGKGAIEKIVKKNTSGRNRRLYLISAAKRRIRSEPQKTSDLGG